MRCPNCGYEIRKEKQKLRDGLEQDFDTFWGIYPVKKAKTLTRQYFYKLNPSSELFLKMVNTLRVQVMKWAKEDYKYTPNPMKWLKHEPWNDELPSTNTTMPGKPMMYRGGYEPI